MPAPCVPTEQPPIIVDGFISSDFSDINETVESLEIQASINLDRYIQARDAFQAKLLASEWILKANLQM